MPKGYIDFDTFKEKVPSKRKKRLPLCARCKKPMEFVMTNTQGKRICPDCLWEEEQRREAKRKKRAEKEAKALKEIDEEKETFDVEE